MIVATPEEKVALIEGGKRLGIILEELAGMVAPGLSTQALEDHARARILEGGDVPAFLNYTPDGAERPFPAALCVSINDAVVHGIPNEHPRIIKKGDIVSLDFGLTHKGFVVDSALTVAMGVPTKKIQSLLSKTEEALRNGIQAAKVGARIGDVSHAIGETFKGTGFAVVKELGGHGVGRHVHEEPWIANFGHLGTGEEIVEGMVLALEPIANEGRASVILDNDGYTFRTRDGSFSAHFEHTILIESSGVTILTKRPSEK